MTPEQIKLVNKLAILAYDATSGMPRLRAILHHKAVNTVMVKLEAIKNDT